MHAFQGIAVDAGVSVDGDCTMTHMVTSECIEIDFGQSTGGLSLCLTEDATVKLANLIVVALEDFRQNRATADQSGRSRPQ